jgi:predicted dinucleotide-binding enzyme
VSRHPDRSALPIAGDDPIAKAAVTAFLDAIGYDTVDAGRLVLVAAASSSEALPSSHHTAV